MDARLAQIKKLLSEQSLDAVLISSVPNIIYLSGYTGFIPEERDAYLFITKDSEYIFTNLLYAEAMESAVPHLKLIEITRDKPFGTSLQNLIEKHKTLTLGYEEKNLTVAEFKSISSLKTKLKPVDLSQLRIIKEAKELTSMKKACRLTDEAFELLLKQIKPGVTEIELEQMLALFFMKHGAESSFRAVVAFGKNTTVPHHLAGKTTLQKNDVILIDFGAKVDNYCADVSRTFFMGKATPKQKEIYQLVLDTQQKTIAYIQNRLTKSKPIIANITDQFARDFIKEKGYPPFPYSLGHGVGLEVHERPTLNPRYKDKLASGMLFTLEPGIHLTGEIGVRIEDVFVIKGKKLIQLSKSPRHLIEL